MHTPVDCVRNIYRHYGIDHIAKLPTINSKQQINTQDETIMTENIHLTTYILVTFMLSYVPVFYLHSE